MTAVKMNPHLRKVEHPFQEVRTSHYRTICYEGKLKHTAKTAVHRFICSPPQMYSERFPTRIFSCAYYSYFHQGTKLLFAHTRPVMNSHPDSYAYHIARAIADVMLKVPTRFLLQGNPVNAMFWQDLIDGFADVLE